MAEQERTTETSIEQCQARCAMQDGCAYYTYWPDGGCNLQDSSATLTDDGSGAIAAPVTCNVSQQVGWCYVKIQDDNTGSCSNQPKNTWFKDDDYGGSLRDTATLGTCAARGWAARCDTEAEYRIFEPFCKWSDPHPNKYSGGYPSGYKTYRAHFDAAKSKCSELGGFCAAVTCRGGDLTSCSLHRGKSLGNIAGRTTWKKQCIETTTTTTWDGIWTPDPSWKATDGCLIKDDATAKCYNLLNECPTKDSQAWLQSCVGDVCASWHAGEEDPLMLVKDICDGVELAEEEEKMLPFAQQVKASEADKIFSNCLPNNGYRSWENFYGLQRLNKAGKGKICLLPATRAQCKYWIKNAIRKFPYWPDPEPDPVPKASSWTDLEPRSPLGNIDSDNSGCFVRIWGGSPTAPWGYFNVGGNPSKKFDERVNNNVYNRYFTQPMCCGAATRDKNTAEIQAARGPDGDATPPPPRMIYVPATAAGDASIDRPTNAIWKVCVIWGDPHIRPFDGGVWNDWYIHGTFWIVKSQSVWIQGYYDKIRITNPHQTCMTMLAIGGPFLAGNTFMIEPVFESNYAAHAMRLWWHDGTTISQATVDVNSAAWASPDNAVKVTPSVTGKGKPYMKIDLVQHDLMLRTQGKWPHYPPGKSVSGPFLRMSTIRMRQITAQDGHCGNFNRDSADDTYEAILNRENNFKVPADYLLMGLA